MTAKYKKGSEHRSPVRSSGTSSHLNRQGQKLPDILIRSLGQSVLFCHDRDALLQVLVERQAAIRLVYRLGRQASHRFEVFLCGRGQLSVNTNRSASLLPTLGIRRNPQPSLPTFDHLAHLHDIIIIFFGRDEPMYVFELFTLTLAHSKDPSANALFRGNVIESVVC